MSYEYMKDFGGGNGSWEDIMSDNKIPLNVGSSSDGWAKKNLGMNWMSSSHAGADGSMIKDMGILDYGLGALSAFNGWNETQNAEDMYELSRDKFKFSQDNYWRDLAMRRDGYNRKINQNSAYRSMFADLNAGGTGNRAAISSQYEGVGSGIVAADGTQSNIVDIPSEYSSGANGANTGKQANTVAPVVPVNGGTMSSAFAKTAQPIRQVPANKKKIKG